MEKIEPLEEVIERAKVAFQEEFGAVPTLASQAPGRVNIIGEYTDYNEGFVFPMAIPLCTVIVGKPNSTGNIRLLTLSDVDGTKTLEFDAPTETVKLTSGNPNWANYVKGVIHHFPAPISGFDATVVTTVPLGGGLLSSSASLEVATCTFLEGLTGKQLTKTEKALLCQKAEHTFANMPCGIMDQFVSCMGVNDGALLVDCRSLETKTVMLDKLKDGQDDIVFLVVNSNVKHQLSASEYPERRSDCFEAAEKLGVKSLRDATITALRDNREKIGERAYQRALHVVSENERCLEAVECIASGDLEGLGRLMYQSHVSLRDLYQVSCPELDQLVDITMQVPGVYGSRMTGGGFGGCIVAMVKASRAAAAVEAVHQKYAKKATAYIFTAKQGASIVSLSNIPFGP